MKQWHTEFLSPFTGTVSFGPKKTVAFSGVFRLKNELVPGGTFRATAYFGTALTVTPGPYSWLLLNYRGERGSGRHYNACDVRLAVSY